MRGVDAGGLDTVLRFFYSGECRLDYTNVIPVSTFSCWLIPVCPAAPLFVCLTTPRVAST